MIYLNRAKSGNFFVTPRSQKLAFSRSMVLSSEKLISCNPTIILEKLKKYHFVDNNGRYRYD
jgi:hypothetical protein